jgi:hypothetical protein
MGCSATEASTEYDFVTAIVRLRTDGLCCVGPYVRLGFSASTLEQIESAFMSPVAHDLLWAGYEPEPIDAMYFTLCALHWMELACLVNHRGHMFDDIDWQNQGATLLERICQTQGWDPKEIANGLAWRTTTLP